MPNRECTFSVQTKAGITNRDVVVNSSRVILPVGAPTFERWRLTTSTCARKVINGSHLKLAVAGARRAPIEVNCVKKRACIIRPRENQRINSDISVGCGSRPYEEILKQEAIGGMPCLLLNARE